MTPEDPPSIDAVEKEPATATPETQAQTATVPDQQPPSAEQEHHHFLPVSLATNIINSASLKVLKKLAKASGYKFTDSFETRVDLLHQVEDIIQGTAKPKAAFSRAMLDQLTAPAISKELDRLGVTPNVNTASYKRSLLVKLWCDDEEAQPTTKKPVTVAKRKRAERKRTSPAKHSFLKDNSNQDKVVKKTPEVCAKGTGNKPAPSKKNVHDNQSIDTPEDIVTKKMEERLLSLEKKIDTLLEERLAAGRNPNSVATNESIQNLQKIISDQQRMLRDQQSLIAQLATRVSEQQQSIEILKSDVDKINSLRENYKTAKTPVKTNQNPTDRHHRAEDPANKETGTVAHTDQPSTRNDDKEEWTTVTGKKPPPRTKIAPVGRDKCLIIHDAAMAKFDKKLFSKSYDVQTHQLGALNQLSPPRADKLEEAIKSFRPRSIVLHVGREDIIGCLRQGTPCTKSLSQLKSLVGGILENTPSNLCVSLPVPAPSLPPLNTRITNWIEEMRAHITELRKNPLLRNRVFTTDNTRLGEHTKTETAGDGSIRSVLTQHGENKLWMNLRDGMNRMSNPSTQSRRYKHEG